ncbi:MAG: transposase [Desmonostoc vinosum HA7617-LM4]|jgi:hypothetical protein|nr:transposase [Desmonostoc vinosum HA7617-LM4]
MEQWITQELKTTELGDTRLTVRVIEFDLRGIIHKIAINIR